ncbi:lipid-A-disaccharide synthase [Aliarcobacter trophiarum LMG 25534]|uniref:Lipid-A-disaccharide synthase n=1 Tax=Aliarcobacter trophiarum LMG 25534 TaxID=1032241 RepID=A0AAD0QKH2_9BACT|nr:lipid-A-disaccharide synthase [Aliarcobacter trophiarum]AXK49704.1 lipid A disaccharide synthase [Aliarcobacter trophiarum LMG 25534]RXI25738.1 lipid-A-disaccharide synthase [Aliarcobacter trophiarum]RXJ89369.1 lipid-A-disaccharide synthase [Aliarcobacter trophiarum LMG 25534]
MKILVSAMETSSNIHLKELKKYLGEEIEIVGVFDKELGNPLYDLSSLAIMGFVDAIKKLRFFFRLRDELVNLAKDCDKVLLLDSSGFNLPLAKKLRQTYPNLEIIYYILPQAWAWKRKRVIALEKYCTKLCSILPFESDIYNDKEKITYVGHPLLDEIKEFKQEIIDSNKIVFMPGSRATEIKNLMPIFKELIKKIPNKEYILVIPSKFDDEYIKKVYGDINDFIISKNSHKALLEAEYAFICSGTATLEAALIGTPFTLSYIAKKFDFFIGKTFVKLNFVGLANIFFEKMGRKQLHSEFLQNEVSVENLLYDYKTFDKNLFFENSKLLREYLKYGSSRNMATIIKN